MKIDAVGKIRLFLILVSVAFVITSAVQWIIVEQYNSHTYTTVSNDETAPVYMSFGNRGDNTSTWTKNGFLLCGEEVDVTGETVDGVLHNNADSKLAYWTMRYDVTQECFLNQAWNGTLEIHQYVGTEEETVQTLNLQKYEESELEVEYILDGNLYIPLEPGDYFIYQPSAKFKEIELEPGDEITIGVIFYHQGDLNYGSYSIDYNFHMTYNTGLGFYLVLTFMILGVYLLIALILSRHFYRKAKNELELKISGISCMSELYAIVYMVDFEIDKLTPVIVEPETEARRPKDIGAHDALLALFTLDSIDAYKDIILDFVDTDTVPERLSDRSNVTSEYISKSYGWCQLRFIAMERGQDGTVSKCLFTVQVIDREKKEMQEIQNRVDKAESENRAKSAFLANMSHEIRTPINTVLGLDTMILRESKEDNIRTYAKDIRHAGNMLLDLINGILDFSKLESGRMQLVPAQYSLTGLLRDIRSIINTKMKDKGLDFTIDVDKELPDSLFGDDVRIKQVIINLLTNAAKYTQEGHVTLSLKCVSMSAKVVRILVAVEDTGMGIREEDVSKLSQRFVRLDENKNRSIEGTGIGINLITGLLRLMNSDLRIESEYGKGSRFYFELKQKIEDVTPVGEIDWSECSTTDDEIYSVSFKAPNAHVLVVDDNEMNLMVFENLLKETELVIDKASSGAAALEKTLGSKYDIIFMDHMMPGMDGVETFTAIRNQKNGLNTATPEIILTANAVQGAREEFLKQGFVDYISKPIQPEILEEKIMQYLPAELCTRYEGGPSQAASAVSLPSISGIDSAYALEHIGSPDGVIKAMKQFVNVADSETAELMSYYDRLRENPSDEDALSSFRIKVHAMKTSAGLVGGLMVYGAAAQLEYAARDLNVQEVLDITPYFTEFWNGLRDSILTYFSDADGASGKADEIDREKLESYLHQLITSMNSYDIKNADTILDKLDKYGNAPEIKADLAGLKTAVANLDAAACEDICNRLLKA